MINVPIECTLRKRAMILLWTTSGSDIPRRNIRSIYIRRVANAYVDAISERQCIVKSLFDVT